MAKQQQDKPEPFIPIDMKATTHIAYFMASAHGMALLPLGSSFAFAAFTVAVWTVGEMLSFPIASAVVADRAKEDSLGRYMGVFNLTFATSYVAAPLIGTWVYQSWGPKALWYGCGVVGAMIWAGFHLLAVARRRAIESVDGA